MSGILRWIYQRFRRQPQVGIAVIINRGGKFLFGLRKKKVGHDTYQIPGGHLEMFETFEQGAIREVREETGLELENVKFLTVTNNPWKEYGKHYITIFMTADAKDGPITSHHSNWEWFWPFPQPLFESDPVFKSEAFRDYYFKRFGWEYLKERK